MLRLDLETADGASYPALPGVYPSLPTILPPPGYRLPEVALFGVPGGSQPRRLLVRGVQPVGGEAAVELADAGSARPTVPPRAQFVPRPFAEAFDVRAGNLAAVVAVAVQDGRVRVRLEAQNETTEKLEPARLINAEAVDGGGDVRALEALDAPVLTLAYSKASWETAKPRPPPPSRGTRGRRSAGPGPARDALAPAPRRDRRVRHLRRATRGADAASGRAGLVTTLAGSTLNGYADGATAAASFHPPTGVAVDPLGDVLVK